MDWHNHALRVRPHVVRITTPDLSGTGFLIRRHEGRFSIATAAHVVRNASTWRQTITIHHDAFTEPLMLWPQDRTVGLHPQLDSAYLSADLPELRDDTFPEEPIELVPLDRNIRQGVEVGWLGYPYMVPNGALCFFCGHVSAHGDQRYFIDGVSIPGVSGGPAFCMASAGRGEPERLTILGSITAYSPNRADGEALPGLMVADNCTGWPGILRNIGE